MAQFEKSIVIDAPLESVFRLCSRLEDLPKIVPFVKEVKQVGFSTYRWKVAGPAGNILEWETAIRNFVPNKQIEWQVLTEDADNPGMLVFHRTPQGTRVSLMLKVDTPTGRVSELLGSIMSDPAHRLQEALTCIKAELEQACLVST